MAKPEQNPNNYRPLKSMVRKFRCYLCEKETSSPAWREFSFGTRVPLCEKCSFRDGGNEGD